ncbi:uncharacterized protein [Henckelia pumila]|uniref:uncharacterized protein isoform X3 n=1 Tax=Henckelia pumila TaxID=405737 RepID=UPI003C6EA1EC
MLEAIIYAFLFGTNSLSMKFQNKIGVVLQHYAHGCWKFQISSWIAILKEEFMKYMLRKYKCVGEVYLHYAAQSRQMKKAMPKIKMSKLVSQYLLILSFGGVAHELEFSLLSEHDII